MTGYVRSGKGRWVQLNKTPLPHYDRKAKGTANILGFGSRKLKDANQNLLEMDNIQVRQLALKE